MGAGEHPVKTGVILALIAMLCAACSSAPGRTTSDSLGVGTQVFPVAERTPAPSLSGTTINGAPFDLD